MSQLDPPASEFKSLEAAEAYNAWFRAKVQKAMADTRPKIPHDQVMAHAHAVIDAARSTRDGGPGC